MVVKTDTLAGFVAAEPVFEAIRKAHPDATISLLTLPSLQRIARASSYFDQVASIPDWRDQEARKVFVQQLKNAKFRRAYALSVDDAAKRVQGALGAFGPKWRTADAPVKLAKGEVGGHRLPALDRLCASAGFDAAARRPDFAWAADARKDAANMRPDWFGVSGPFGLFAPGSDPARRWRAEAYGELGRIAARQGVTPVVVGAKELHGFGDEICETAPEVVDLTGKTDHLQLAALARQCGFFVSDCAEEAELITAAGAAGVMVKSARESQLTPQGRHVLAVTGRSAAAEVEPEYVWRALCNMGLAPAESPRRIAAR